MDLFQPPATVADRGHHQPSNYSGAAQPAKPRRRVPAKTERLIGELGLRYRPSAAADLEEHAAGLALLASDVADIPPHILEQAVDRWVRASRFMPKASELVDLARSILVEEGQVQPKSLQERVDEANVALRAQGKFHIEWFVEGEGMRLRAVG